MAINMQFQVFASQKTSKYDKATKRMLTLIMNLIVIYVVPGSIYVLYYIILHGPFLH